MQVQELGGGDRYYPGSDGPRPRPARPPLSLELSVAPPPEQWDEWSELDPAAWPERRERHYALIPTICFNCESACGLVANVDKETERITKFEDNPVHPGARGRTCAKGPATINQVHDPERILRPSSARGNAARASSRR